MTTYKEWWILGRLTLVTRPLVNPSRSPISSPCGDEPSQQAQAGSITPRRAVKWPLRVYKHAVGTGLCVGRRLYHLHNKWLNTMLSPLNVNIMESYYLLIVGRGAKQGKATPVGDGL